MDMTVAVGGILGGAGVTTSSHRQSIAHASMDLAEASSKVIAPPPPPPTVADLEEQAAASLAAASAMIEDEVHGTPMGMASALDANLTKASVAAAPCLQAAAVEAEATSATRRGARSR